MMQRRTFNKFLGAGLVAAAVPKIVTPAQAAVTKVGFVYFGPVGDFGWTYQHDVGRQLVEKTFGDKVKTTYVENVPESADAERVIANLAAKGHQLIFTTSFGYMDPTLKAAKRFPKAFFEHCAGYKTAPNVSVYNVRFYEGRYVQGVIAGMMSKTGVGGYIASIPIPEVIMGMNAFLLGMRSVNPKATVKFIMCNTWYDPGIEGDAAKALIDQGCDIITQHTDSTAPLQICAQRGVKGFGEATDMVKFAPTAQLSASVNNWGPYYVKRVQDVMDGKWKSETVWGGLAADMMEMAPYRNMPDNVVAAAKQTEEDIKGGKIVIFKGPLKDQSGVSKSTEGAVLDDGSISSMNWLVEGVIGQLPK